MHRTKQILEFLKKLGWLYLRQPKRNYDSSDTHDLLKRILPTLRSLPLQMR